MQRKSALQQPRKPTGNNKRNEPGNVLKTNDIAKNNEPGKPGFEPGKPGFEPGKRKNRLAWPQASVELIQLGLAN